MGMEGGTAEKLVCVTGGTGYIASCLIQSLLKKGYRVRTTARDPDDKSKTGFLWELPGAKERLQIVKADLVEEGSFDAAVYGVDGVFHTACPVLYGEGDPQVTMLNPCLHGSMNVLKACTKSPSIQRIVMTSSCSAIRYDYNHTDKDPPMDESTWSNLDYCKQYQMWYAMAKTLAEREAFEFAKKEGLDLVVVNPSFVMGSMLAPVPTSTISVLLHLVKGAAKEYPNIRIGWVHIDDVVTAHVLALEVPGARGRYICSAEVAHFSDVMQMLKQKYPKLQVPTRCNNAEGNDIHHTLNTTKIQRLGLLKFKSLEEMFVDFLSSVQQHGLLQDYH